MYSMVQTQTIFQADFLEATNRYFFVTIDYRTQKECVGPLLPSGDDDSFIIFYGKDTKPKLLQQPMNDFYAMPFDRLVNYICLTNAEQNFIYNDCTDYLINKRKNYGLILVTE